MVNDTGVCFLGDCTYKWNQDTTPEKSILDHLLTEHKVVIANVNNIYDVNQYCVYWRSKINSKNLEEHLHGVNVHKKNENGESELFYMKNDSSDEDKTVRFRIYNEKLNKILLQQQKERQCKDFKIPCLFCPETLTGSRFTVSEHMYGEHSFSLGHPDNLVYTVEFLEKLRAKMERSECLYCDKTFRNYKTLREHMRKKLHKKLNPANKEFDKYYIVNYREFGKTWQTLDKDDKDYKSESERDESWDDWEERPPNLTCLVCECSYVNIRDLKQHLVSQHFVQFDLLLSGLSYYQQVKMINYFRYSISDDLCPFCKLPSKAMSDHLFEHKHEQGMSHDLYDDDRYLCPALDNDFLLCLLDSERGGDQDNVIVIPEDIT